MWFRAELRTRWRAWLGLALLIGLGAGVVIAAAAGARRTDSAYSRFLVEQRAFDVLAIGDFCPGPEELEPGEQPYECDVTKVADLPQVSEAALVESLSADVRTADGRSIQPGGDENYTGPGEVFVLGSPDGAFGGRINRLRMLDGRRPRDDAPDEVALSKALAARADVHVGDRLRAAFATTAGSQLRRQLRVVGIEVAPGELVPPSGTYLANLHVSRALLESARADGAHIQRGLALRLEGGDRSVEALRGEIDARRIRAFVAFRQAGQSDGIERAIRPQVVALTLLAALAGLAMLAVFGAVLARQAWTESSGYSTLWALGMRRGQLVRLTIIRAAAVGLLALPVAVIMAFLLSPLAPIGLAHDAEPQPGLRLDWFALGAGAALTVVVVALLVLWPAWRVARAATTADDDAGAGRRPSTAAKAMTRIGFSTPAVVGTGMAFERGGGRGSVPVRSGFLGVTAGMVALGAAFGFGASVQHLLDTPRLIGLSWDAAVVFGERDPDDVDGLTRHFERVPGVAAATPGSFIFYPPFIDHPLLLGPRRLPVELLALGPGTVTPSVIDGRAPVAADEILLATETIDELDLEIGDTVTAIGQVGESERADARQDTNVRVRVVGVGVVPPISGSAETESRLGRGAVMTVPGLQRLNPVATATALYVRFDSDTGNATGVAALRRAARALPGREQVFDFGGEQADFEGFLDISQVDDLPLLLGGLVAVVATGVLAHVLVTSARARRRDLAVLRAIGFRRGQVRSTVTWQGLTITVVALVVGLPLGVALGRWGWQIYARSIGVVPEPGIDGIALLAVVTGAVLVTVVVAMWPAHAAARRSPAAVLRTE
jgi:hypothetical protein